jgi:hypothetical protein
MENIPIRTPYDLYCVTADASADGATVPKHTIQK